MPDASHMPSICRLHAWLQQLACGELFSWVGRGGGKKSSTRCHAFFFSFLLFGPGWAVCAVARWVNSISTIAWRAIPSPRDEGISPVLWLIGRPWPKEAAIHAAAPRLSTNAAPLPLAMPRVTVTMALQPPDGPRTLCEGGGSYPRSFWPSAAGFGRARTKWKGAPA